MREAAANLEFEEAARLRDEIRKLEDKELGLATARPSPAPRAAGAAWKPTSGSRDDKRRAAQAKAKVAPAGGAVAWTERRRSRLRPRSGNPCGPSAKPLVMKCWVAAS